MNLKNIAKEVFEIESKEIANLSNLLTDDFQKAVCQIAQSKGKLIVCGIGKSGIIGKKIAATLASTGTPSFFLHPSEAYHGDLGMIQKQDIVLLISNSGETDEILKIIPFLKQQNNYIIAMSSNPKSTLSKNSDRHLNIAVEKEACPLQLAPTSSTTAALVMGDALAVALMKMKGFENENFARFHPGGSLGKKLLTKVCDVMKKDTLPTVHLQAPITEIITTITKGKCGLVAVKQNNQIKGVITDGDVRRTMTHQKSDFFTLKAKDLMNKNPKTIDQNQKWAKAIEIMNEHQISGLLVVDENQNFVGVVEVFNH